MMCSSGARPTNPAMKIQAAIDLARSEESSGSAR
jgi:hypothetical protein